MTSRIDFNYMINRAKYIHNHPDVELFFNHFIDYENAVISFTDKDFESYFTFFEDLKKTNIRRKWAVYTKNEITHKTANMHHLFESGKIEVEVFQNREMALAFLGITEEDLADY